ADDKKARDPRKDGGVDDAQPRGAVDAKIAADNSAAVARPDRAGAGGVVTPGGAAHELFQLLVAVVRLAGLLLGGDQALRLEPGCQLSDKTDAGHDRVEILTGGVAALLEIVEVDQRRVPRVGRA